MKHASRSIVNKMVKLKQWDRTYKKLQQHLDKMPVGFPATFSGVERRLLKAMFNVEEAQLAVYMDYRFESAETIFNKARSTGWPLEKVQALLSAMEKNGAIFAKEIDGMFHYALVPFAVGMYEMQLVHMKPDYYLDTREYMTKKFAIEFLTSGIPQMRVIPVEKSITPAHNIATYDEVRDIIEKTEKRIGIAECICRKGKDLVAQPCQATERREICIGLRDFHDTYSRNNWGRTISKEEALASLDQCEKEGLVLQPSNEQEPQFICVCCGCCCGVLEMMRTMPRPADFAASNFYAVLDTEACNGCGRCVKRCQMDALTLTDDKKAVLNTGKCIGCGLCVTTCKPGALRLVKKETETIPPRTTEELFDTIMEQKKTKIGKYMSAARGALGMKP